MGGKRKLKEDENSDEDFIPSGKKSNIVYPTKTKKPSCSVCGEEKPLYNTHGASNVCKACQSFVLSYATTHQNIPPCQKNKDCYDTVPADKEKKKCRRCRFLKCLKVGIKLDTIGEISKKSGTKNISDWKDPPSEDSPGTYSCKNIHHHSGNVKCCDFAFSEESFRYEVIKGNPASSKEVIIDRHRNYTCRDSHLIYGDIGTLCGELYIGYTDRQLNERDNEKRWIIEKICNMKKNSAKEKDPNKRKQIEEEILKEIDGSGCPGLVEHFTDDDHFEKWKNYYRVTVITKPMVTMDDGTERVLTTKELRKIESEKQNIYQPRLNYRGTVMNSRKRKSVDDSPSASSSSSASTTSTSIIEELQRLNNEDSLESKAKRADLLSQLLNLYQDL